MDKLVSIILPTYNGSGRIVDAVKSIISQSYDNWELLVVDDGSIDNTEFVIDNLVKDDKRIKYFKNKINLGIQKTLNRGLKEAKGEYIARIDDDDEWVDKDKLHKQVEFLNNNLDIVLVGTGVVVVNDNNNELFRYLLPGSDREIRNKILGKNCFVHSSVMFKKDAVLGFNGYDESKDTRHVEDYDLWLKLGTIGKFANLPIYAVKFTSREGSISSTNKIDQFKKDIKLIKNYKNKYPNYFGAIIRSYARLVVYGLILKSPIKFSLNKLIKFYKKNW
ncbi:MAG: glycosyltransferase family 2 protein [Candidatus Nomurabacteria bacterium]|nr:glycosyltransferase family 2 protein [Candidatus Nomurabacteria bacterium]